MKGQIPMNEEEKEAIFEIKKLMIDIYNYMDIGKTRFYRTKYQIILELIDKQQKEIESRLKEIDSLYKMMSAKDERIEHLTELVNKYNDMQYIRKIEELYISKDKIREIREKYKKERANMTQIIFSKYGKTQRTFNQAVVNEVIKVIDELLGE